MPKGFSIPVRANASGGIALSKGDANDAKIIRIALADGDNNNAFQQGVTVNQTVIFDLNDSSSRARVAGNIEDIFEKFEKDKRFKLLEDTMDWGENEGELLLEFKYLCLESDEERTFAHTFRTTR